MKVAVLRFPGSNCDQDALHALRGQMGLDARYVWHEDRSLAGFDAVFIPGGFSYGDYLRCGAIAAQAPIIDEVRSFAEAGRPVIGVCNGFQVLCEAGLLPGALLRNATERFSCRTVIVAPEGTSPWVQGVSGLLRIPIAHGEGRYVYTADEAAEVHVAFRYVDEHGRATEESNPNGSMDSIAGVTNTAGNVLGMMPHPERACSPLLGSTDGLTILRALTGVSV